jgi:hypothetical protein
VKAHVLFIPPGYLLSLDTGLRSVPATNTFLTELETHFDVDINITGEQDPQTPLPGERTENDDFPSRLHDAQSAVPPARKTIEFIHRHST